MRVRYGALIFRFGNEYATCVRIKRTPEYVEKKIPFAYETDAESCRSFRARCSAIRAAATEVKDVIEIGAVACMDIGVHNNGFNVKLILNTLIPPDNGAFSQRIFAVKVLFLQS